MVHSCTIRNSGNQYLVRASAPGSKLGSHAPFRVRALRSAASFSMSSNGIRKDDLPFPFLNSHSIVPSVIAIIWQPWFPALSRISRRQCSLFIVPPLPKIVGYQAAYFFGHFYFPFLWAYCFYQLKRIFGNLTSTIFIRVRYVRKMVRSMTPH